MVDTIAEKVIFCRLAVKVCADRITREGRLCGADILQRSL